MKSTRLFLIARLLLVMAALVFVLPLVLAAFGFEFNSRLFPYVFVSTACFTTAGVVRSRARSAEVIERNASAEDRSGGIPPSDWGSSAVAFDVSERHNRDSTERDAGSGNPYALDRHDDADDDV
jgi:hypothetical protein